MSTLEVVRDLLCQTAEAPPDEVLRSAQDELARLSHLVQNAKNVLQRNGARKKLAELEPLMAKMEIEVALVQLEQSLDQVKNGAQRAAVRVQAQKLAAQITGLAPSEEKELFQQWLAEVIPSLASTPPDSTPTRSVALALTSAAPSISTAPREPTPTAAPPPDPTLEIQTSLAFLETQAKTRPIANPSGLLEETLTLARRITALSPSEIRTKLTTSIESITTALKQDEERLRLGEAIGRLEEASALTDTDVASLLVEHDRIASGIGALSTGPERDALRQKLSNVKASLAARWEGVEIERALQQCAGELQKNPSDETAEARLKALVQRIGQLTDAKARATFSERSDSLRKTLEQRRQETEISANLTQIADAARAADASFSTLRSSLDEIASRLQTAPPNQGRTDLEKRIRECRDLITAQEQKPISRLPQTAVVLQLDPVKGRSAPTSRPVIFVARDRFSIGRKPENEPPRADLLTPSAELRISRIHVTFFARQRQIHALAGDEGKPSTNPALVDEIPLGTSPMTVNFEHERRINLTGVFTLRAQLMPSSSPYGPPFEDENNINHNTTVVIPPITGALRIRPQGDDRLPVAAVWLFTDATIGANPNCAVTLPQPGMAPEEVRIHFWKKSFWIEVLRPESLVQLAGKTLHPGASQPLLPGQELRLGNSIYTIKLF